MFDTLRVMEIRFMKLDSSLPDLSFAYHADAGVDLYARETVTLSPGERAKIPSGIALAIPEGYVGLVWDKSGVSNNHGIKTLGGVIDAGYRGEVMVGVINLSGQVHTFEKGDKVAQLLIQKIEQPAFIQADSLDDTHRGDAGFGSSGK